jgi:para-aminobenzoate synthetase component 2
VSVPRILVIDNYDSFVFNLVQYLAQLGADVTVKRNQDVTLDEAISYDGVLISPGPGTPQDAGMCLEIVQGANGAVPIFGVCLGHQVIAEAFGGVISRAPELLHGKTSQISHTGKSVMSTLPENFTATRYHSLALDPDTVPETLTVTAVSETGVIMGVKHVSLPIEGVQFHPESVLTEGGHEMLANWLNDCGFPEALEKLATIPRVTITSQA